MFIMGLDIGYSNLKVVFGEPGNRQEAVLPVGAGPATLMPRNTFGGAVDAIYVDVDGEPYVAGVEPDRLQGWARELNDSYITSKAYKALFYAALSISGQEVIDRLVTGLPVSHYNDKYISKLVDMMQGEHQIAPKVSVEVKEVLVVPQPGGAYHHTFENISDKSILELISFGRSVVIDPGYFSVDYVALTEGEIRYLSSGSSLEAMSFLMKATSEEIQKDYSVAPSVESLEKAVRGNRPFIVHNGRKVELASYLKKAEEAVAPIAMTEVKNTMRKDGHGADVLIIAGGGANFYKKAAETIFPDAVVVVPENPVIANADGFWHLGAV